MKEEVTPLPPSVQQVLELSPYAMCASDIRAKDQPIVYVNDRFLEHTKYHRSDILGINCRFLQGKDTDRLTVKEMATTIAAGKVFLGRLLNYTKDGHPIWNYLLMQPLRNPEGVVTHYTALQMFVDSEDAAKIAEVAKEMSGVADHMEDTKPEIMEMMQEMDLSAMGISRRPPKAPSRQSLDMSSQPRRHSVVNLDSRQRLELTLKSNHVMCLIVNTQREDWPVVYCSAALRGELWLSEEEVLGGNLSFLLGSPNSDQDRARYAALVAAVAEGKAITQDRYLRKRVGNALYGRFQFMPIRLGLGGSAAALSDGVPPYYIGMYTKEVLSEEAEVTIPEIPEDTMEQLLENATQLVQEIHTEKRAGGDGQLRSFARMSIELRERPAPPASAAVKKSSLFAGSATTISPITEVADEGRQRSQDCASSLAEADDEGVTVSLDDESDSVAEMPALRPERRLSMMRRRRSGAHFTLLPAKAQWIELVLKAMADNDWGMSEHQLAAIKANLGKLGKNLIN